MNKIQNGEMTASYIMEHGDNNLTNKDLVPVDKAKRDWSWVNMSTVWMGMVHNIVAYEAAAGLIAMGMNALQAILCVGTAYFALFIAMWFNAKAGTKYGIPFCVIIRSSFGPFGAQIPVIVRAFVAIFWFSIQLYAGSQALNAIFGVLWSPWSSMTYGILGMPLNGWISLGLFWVLTATVMNHGVHRIRNFELIAGPLVILVGAAAVVWAISASGGLGPIVSQPSRLPGGWVGFFEFAVGASGILGIWTTFAVNIPDLTRFARSQKDQAIGQLIGLPFTAIIFTAMSVLVTSASVTLFGHAIWDPTTLLLAINNPIATVIGGATIVLATLSVNVAANILPAAYDLVNLFPRKMNFIKASMIVMVLGVLYAPWLWFQNASTIFRALGMIGGLLGPVTGIMLVDYYYMHKQTYDVLSLYKKSPYLGKSGTNFAGVGAMILGSIFSLIGFFVEPLKVISDFSWFVGILSGGLAYVVLDSICISLNRRRNDSVTVQSTTAV
jgi:NCS1 family nucleobase:cation symporter-1